MKTNPFFKAAVIVSVFCTALVFAFPGGVCAQKTDLAGRLKNLSEEIEAKRVESNIPGMALVIVKDDKIIFCKGYGLANVEKKTPVTEKTLFRIGSSTKPFTSTLAAMLVTDKKMCWDDPITKYLPEFKLPIDTENKEDQITIRDLLSHRTGFVHLDITTKVFFDPKGWTREKILKEALEGHEPKAPFRTKHFYNNIGIIAAGVATGIAAGKDWDALMTERMFKPLGMQSTTTLTAVAKKDPNLATGYMVQGSTLKAVEELHELDCVGPAGGISSNLQDMVQWMRLMLGIGVYNGKRLIGEKELRETWTKQIAVDRYFTPGADYGLGWFLREWKGLHIVEHGGNAMGFSAQVSLIPERKLGFTMLSNALPCALQFSIIDMVWKALLEEE